MPSAPSHHIAACHRIAHWCLFRRLSQYPPFSTLPILKRPSSGVPAERPRSVRRAMAPRKETAKRPNEEPEPGVVPLSKRPLVAAEVAPVCKKPTLPSPDGSDMGSKHTMKFVVPWVMQELPSLLGAKGQDLKKAQPLVLPHRQPAQGKDSAACSYKEPWVPEHCWSSCQVSGLYEAGGNLMWIDPEVSGDSCMPCGDPPYHLVHEIAKTQFVPIMHNDRERIRFPVALHCWWRSGVQALPKNDYPDGGLAPLGGHAFLWGWYLAVQLAMEEADHQRVKLLYQSALTATISVFTTDSRSQLALESIRMSETIRTNAQVSTDSFVTFTLKVNVMLGGDRYELKDLVSKEVRYQGGLINQTMIQVMRALQPFLESSVVMEKLEKLDREHGMDVLTGSYNKLKLFLSAVKSSADSAAWVLESMIVALERKEVAVDSFVLATYQKKRNGEPNFLSTALATRTTISHLISLAEGVETFDVDLAKLLKEKVTAKLRSPALWHASCPCPVGGSGVPGGCDVPPCVDFMETLSDTGPRGAVLLAEVMKKVYEGAYPDGIAALASSNSPETLLRDTEEKELGHLATDILEVMRSVRAAETVVGLGGGSGPPKATLRDLVRQACTGRDEEAAAMERQDVWNRAVAQRKKLVTLALVRNPKSHASYQESVSGVPAFAEFKGKVGEAHRVFMLSAELLNQKGKQPWLHTSPPDDKLIGELCQFLTTHGRGACDVIMAFDGGMRPCRRALEDSVGKLPACAEIFVVYENSWNGWIKKKYFLNSENTECGYIALPASKTRLNVKARSASLAACGDKNSHWTSLTGVPLLGRCSLPRISPADKLKIFPEATDALPQKWLEVVPAGVPVFWGETKTVATWESLLDEVSAGVCIDLSPGSGMLASACMKRGTPYLGLVGCSGHMTWLANVVDRSSLKFICQSRNCLYQEDLATTLSELFADVVEESADNTAPEEEALTTADDDV